MTRCIIGAVLLVLAGSSWAGESASIRKNCRVEWPGDIQMKKYCYDNNQDSRRALVRLRRGGQAKIVNGCIRANPGVVAGTDWSDAHLCVLHEMKKARRR